MTGLVRKAAGLGAFGLLLAGAAFAAPSATNSIVPAILRVGGKQTIFPDLPDPSIAYTVTVLDEAGAPVAGAVVDVNLANCSDTFLCDFDFGGQTVDCDAKSVSGTTDAAGMVTFNVLGGGMLVFVPNPPAIAPGAGAGCARVFADGVQISTSTVVLYDQDGAAPPLGVGAAFHNGVKGTDLGNIFLEIGASNLGAPYRGRSDYFTNSVIDGLDASVKLTIIGQSNAGIGSGNGCSDAVAVAAPYCP